MATLKLLNLSAYNELNTYTRIYSLISYNWRSEGKS